MYCKRLSDVILHMPEIAKTRVFRFEFALAVCVSKSCSAPDMPPNKWDKFLSADESVIGGLAGRYAVALFELAQELTADDQSQLPIIWRP